MWLAPVCVHPALTLLLLLTPPPPPQANPAPPVGPALGSKVSFPPGVLLWCGGGLLARPVSHPSRQLQHVPVIIFAQGVNIMAFCKEYNAATSKMAGDVIPVEISVYEVSRAWVGVCTCMAGWLAEEVQRKHSVH